MSNLTKGSGIVLPNRNAVVQEAAKELDFPCLVGRGIEPAWATDVFLAIPEPKDKLVACFGPPMRRWEGSLKRIEQNGIEVVRVIDTPVAKASPRLLTGVEATGTQIIVSPVLDYTYDYIRIDTEIMHIDASKSISDDEQILTVTRGCLDGNGIPTDARDHKTGAGVIGLYRPT